MSEDKKKIYVGNLEYTVTNEDLQAFFTEKGIQPIAADVIKDKYTGRSKGFGFVEVGSEDEIQKAIEGLDGQDLKGRKLRVNKANKPGEGPRRERRF